MFYAKKGKKHSRFYFLADSRLPDPLITDKTFVNESLCNLDICLGSV
jgi:hypothetical protein